MKNNYAMLIQQLYVIARRPNVREICGQSRTQIILDAAAAIADLTTDWIPTTGVGAATPELINHYTHPDLPELSYDYSRRVLGRESMDGPIQIVVYTQDADGKTAWCSDTDETLSIAQWAPLPS